MTEKKSTKKITFVVHSISVDSEFWEKMKKITKKSECPSFNGRTIFFKNKNKKKWFNWNVKSWTIRRFLSSHRNLYFVTFFPPLADAVPELDETVDSIFVSFPILFQMNKMFSSPRPDVFYGCHIHWELSTCVLYRQQNWRNVKKLQPKKKKTGASWFIFSGRQRHVAGVSERGAWKKGFGRAHGQLWRFPHLDLQQPTLLLLLLLLEGKMASHGRGRRHEMMKREIAIESSPLFCDGETMAVTWLDQVRISRLSCLSQRSRYDTKEAEAHLGVTASSITSRISCDFFKNWIQVKVDGGSSPNSLWSDGFTEFHQFAINA